MYNYKQEKKMQPSNLNIVNATEICPCSDSKGAESPVEFFFSLFLR